MGLQTIKDLWNPHTWLLKPCLKNMYQLGDSEFNVWGETKKLFN
jgi:hypothetical protein